MQEPIMKTLKSRSVFFKSLGVLFVLVLSFSFSNKISKGAPAGWGWVQVFGDCRLTGTEVGEFKNQFESLSTGANPSPKNLNEIMSAMGSIQGSLSGLGIEIQHDSPGNLRPRIYLPNDPEAGEFECAVDIFGGTNDTDPTDPVDPNDPTNPTNPTSPDLNILPPDLTSDGVTAMSGKNPSLAFNPVTKLWLVVAENGGKIQGQLMTNINKKSGALLNIGGSSAHTPKVAYSSSASKYLVVWTAGQDPSADLWGQLLLENGSASGPAFKIAIGGAHIYGASNIQYDSSNQRFILAYEKAGNGTDIMVVSISGSGEIILQTKLAGVSSKNSAPSVAVNPKTNEYCVTYLDGAKVKIQPVSSSGTVGTATELDSEGAGNVGIIYSSDTSSYTTAWLTKTKEISSKTLGICADDPEQDSTPMINDAQAGVLTQNINGFGLFMLNSNGTDDKFFSFDISGSSQDEKTIFSGTWATGNLWLAAAPNPLNGSYAAAASPDGNTIKFVAGIGSLFIGPINNGPFPGSQNVPVPNQGLPTDLGKLIEAIFTWSLSLIGLVIFVRFFYAGFLWFTAAGNSGNVSKAKDIMKNAVYGALVLFSAWLILNTINPDLVGGTFNLPGLPAGGAETGEIPPSPTAVCNQKFNVSPSTGCSNINTCVNVSNYTPTHGCETNNDICLLSSPAAERAQTLIGSFNNLAAGKSCALKISSTIQVNNGPSISTCHKPGNTNSGTCADFNIIGSYDTCAPYFYQAAKNTKAVVSFLDEYVPACRPSSATGGNIHVNF